MCQEAVKLAKYLGMSRASFKAFQDLKHDEQMVKAKEAGMDVHNHSGNTYGMAVTLAFIYITKPDHVAKMHGALCPLVGCKDYGCWSTTEEAHNEKREA